MAPFIAIGICTVVAYGCGFLLLKRVRAHLLEFFVTLVASTLPMGIILSAGAIRTSQDQEEIAKAVFFGLLPVCLVIGGSVWGISISNRLQIHSALRRLSMMVLGWAFVLALCSGGGLIPLVLAKEASSAPWREGLIFIAWFSFPVSFAVFMLAGRLEKRAPK